MKGQTGKAPRLGWHVFLVVLLGSSLLAARNRPCPRLPTMQHLIPAPPSPVSSLMVISLNIHKEQDAEKLVQALREVAPGEPDLLLLQEVEVPSQENLGVMRELGQKLGFSWIYAPAEILPGGGRHGLALLARYPLREPEVIPLREFDLHYNLRCRIGLGATLQLPDFPLRAYVTHLDTRINSRQRQAQILPIVERAADFPGAALIGGDLNTNPFRWISHLIPIPFLGSQGEAIRKMMAAHGFSTPFADSGKTHSRWPVKLDWIFFKGLPVRQHGVSKVSFSDHRALWAWLDLSSSQVGTEAAPLAAAAQGVDRP